MWSNGLLPNEKIDSVYYLLYSMENPIYPEDIKNNKNDNKFNKLLGALK